MQEDLVPGLRGGGDRRRAGGRGQHQADAGFEDVDREQPDQERDRRHDLEVNHRPQAHAADRLDVPGPGDAGDQRAKMSGAMIILIRRRNSWLNGLKILRPGRDGCRLTMRAGDDAEHQPEDDLLGQRQPASAAPWTPRMPGRLRACREFYPNGREC